jgi:Flp pilus assembly protein TadD
LRTGVAQAPKAAALHHALALVLVRQKRYADALKALAEAVRLDPGNARYAYVHAVALNDTGQPQQALKVLETALARQPYDRDLLSGLAFYAAQAGLREAALGYAKQLVELDPENPEYAQLAARIEGRTVR